MLHHNTQILVLVLSAFLVAPSVSENIPTSKQMNFYERELTDCDLVLDISKVCYQCSKRHDEDFLMVHNACCSGLESDRDVREYCESIYSTDPRM